MDEVPSVATENISVYILLGYNDAFLLTIQSSIYKLVFLRQNKLFEYFATFKYFYNLYLNILNLKICYMFLNHNIQYTS